MHCRSSSILYFFSVTCYVSNYGAGDVTFGADPQTAIHNAEANTGRIATVAMVYNRALLTNPRFQPQVNRVSFFVYGKDQNDENDGPLLTSAGLDSEGNKAVPGLCITCHGGNYDPKAHNVGNASFLPFDAPTFIFDTLFVSHLESVSRESIRTLNSLVAEATYARPTIAQLIAGWYQWCGGVGAHGCYIDDVGHPFYPNKACTGGAQTPNESCGWPVTWGGIQAQHFYQQVPRILPHLPRGAGRHPQYSVVRGLEEPGRANPELCPGLKGIAAAAQLHAVCGGSLQRILVRFPGAGFDRRVSESNWSVIGAFPNAWRRLCRKGTAQTPENAVALLIRKNEANQVASE